MYNLASRFSTPVDDDTVGPASYFVTDLSCNKYKDPSFPFTATSRRFRKPKFFTAPSPTKYFPKYRKHRIVSGKSLRFTSARICIVPKKKSPPTLSYDSYYQQFTRTQIFYSENRASKRSIFKEKGSTSHRNLNEYFEEFQKKYREALLSQPLPDYLQFPGETSKTSTKYKGSRWSQYKSTRKNLELPSDGPGPGAYNVKPTICVTKKGHTKNEFKSLRLSKHKNIIEEFKPECNVSFESTQPGFQNIDENKMPKVYDPLCGKEIKDKYAEDNFFDGTCNYLYKKVSHNKNPNGLWGSAERFVYKETDTPGPLNYNPIQYKCKRRRVKLVPFSSCAPRFKIPKQSDLSPATYNVELNTIKERTSRHFPPSALTTNLPSRCWGINTPPIDSTAPLSSFIKIQSKYPEDEDEIETNPAYLRVVHLCPPCPSKEVTDSGFKIHQTKTSQNICNSPEYFQIVGTSLVIKEEYLEPELPPNLRDVYNNIRAKKCYRRPMKNEGFLSTQEGRSDWLIRNIDTQSVNWPEIKETKAPCSVNMKPLTYEKKTVENNSAPFYDIHPQYSSAVYKSTHNCRLKGECKSEKQFKNPANVKTILKCFIPKELLQA